MRVKMEELFFSFPTLPEAAVAIIAAIPDTWSWVDGCLSAPPHMLASKEAAKGTGLSISRFHDIHATYIAERSDDKQKRQPDLRAMLVERCLPGFVSFDEAGFGGGLIDLALSKDIAAAYIMRGYTGYLWFFLGWDNDDKFHNRARIRMDWKETGGGILQAETIAPHIGLEFLDRTNVAAIISRCQEIGLTKIEPQ
jgi:hypothetical protein